MGNVNKKVESLRKSRINNGYQKQSKRNEECF